MPTQMAEQRIQVRAAKGARRSTLHPGLCHRLQTASLRSLPAPPAPGDSLQTHPPAAPGGPPSHPPATSTAPAGCAQSSAQGQHLVCTWWGRRQTLYVPAPTLELDGRLGTQCGTGGWRAAKERSSAWDSAKRSYGFSKCRT